MGPGGRDLLYMVQSRKGQVLFLSNGLRTGTACSIMTRRMKIETQALDERTGTSGLSPGVCLPNLMLLFRRRIIHLAGDRLGNPADWRRCGEHRSFLVPILFYQSRSLDQWSACRCTPRQVKRRWAAATRRLPHGTRADEGNRTPNLLITNQLLCQLSYVSECAEKDKLLVGRASAPSTIRITSR